MEEILEDNNCIVKAFENNPISILKEDNGDKKIYYFKASDIGKALGIINIHSTIQNYEDEDERVIRKVYDTEKRMQHTSFLTSQGVYRLLYILIIILFHFNTFYFKTYLKIKDYIRYNNLLHYERRNSRR